MKSQYDVENMDYTSLEDKVILPKFQRRLVWSTKEKENFIETLHNGFPFGSILIYKYEDDTKFSLIDGLQRYTTIRDYQNHPEKYIEFDEFVDRIYSLIASAHQSESSVLSIKDKVNIVLKEYIKYLSDNNSKLVEMTALLERELEQYKSEISLKWKEISEIPMLLYSIKLII